MSAADDTCTRQASSAEPAIWRHVGTEIGSLSVIGAGFARWAS